MQKKLTIPVQLNKLSSYPDLVHGISTRYYTRERELKNELSFASEPKQKDFDFCMSLFMESLGLGHEEIFFVRQVHGKQVYVLEDHETNPPKNFAVSADAIITCLQGQAIGILTADCIPLIIYDPRHHAVAVVHAGRKGTALKICSHTVGKMQKHFGSIPRELIVGLGPGICGSCYEVDESCMEPFRKQYPEWRQFIKLRGNDKFELDLLEANRQDGISAGLEPDNIVSSGHCTACEPESFFSYRRDGTKGRILTLVMLRPRH
jgi:YfiH family protein